MKRAKLVGVMIIVVTLVSFTVNALAYEGDNKTSTEQLHGVAQTTCPVMGGKINKKLYVDYKGKRIYVCCQGCINVIKADPEKYIIKLEKEGVKLQDIPDSETNASTKHLKSN